MNELKIVEPDSKEMEVQGASLLARANALQVTDDASFQLAGDLLQEIKKGRKAVDWLYAESIKAAHSLHKMLCKKSEVLDSPMATAEISTKKKIGDYSMEVERQRREEDQKKRQEEETRLEAERIAKAEQQMDSGDLKGAEQTLEAPSQPLTIRTTITEPPKLAGVSMRDEVKYEITDPDSVPRNMCSPDDKKIRAYVKAMGKATNLPGVRIWVEIVVSSRTF